MIRAFGKWQPAFVILGTLLLLPAHAAAQSCNSKNPNDQNSDSAAIQACLNGGGTIVLELGSPGYIIDEGLVLTQSNTALTAIGDKALLIAHPDLDETMLIVDFSVDDFEISELIFDGNKGNRNVGLCDDGNRGLDTTNLRVSGGGSGFVLHHIDSVNALCGSAMEVNGIDFDIYSNYLADNGFEEGEGSDVYEQWADGLTITGCWGGHAYNNVAVDNTDVGIVVGEGENCVIDYNEIEQTDKYAFAAFHVGTFGVDEAEHTNASYYENTIVSALDKAGFGLAVGMHPWSAILDLADCGAVVENNISGAVVNLAIDGVRAGEVTANSMSDARGGRGKNGCDYSGNYTAGDAEFSNMTVQTGYYGLVNHPSGCYTV